MVPLVRAAVDSALQESWENTALDVDDADGVIVWRHVCLTVLPTVEIKTLVIFVLAFFAGLSAGCGGTIAPSVRISSTTMK